MPADRPGDFAQAVMDLGATICTPKRPACALCPWMTPCRARAAGLQEAFPKKLKKEPASCARARPSWCCAPTTAILLRTRPPQGLLGGMVEPPTSAWEPDYEPSRAMLDAPIEARWQRLPGTVRHVFTHFPLELTVLFAKVAEGHARAGRHALDAASALHEEALPGAMKKVLAHALGECRAEGNGCG